jgi:hypothetical protein
MAHMVGMFQLHVVARRNGVTMTTEHTKGMPKYAIKFFRDGVELGQTRVENWSEGGPECVPLDDLVRIFPNDNVLG